MNYAWEAVLLAEKEGRQREALRFVPAACASPYIEVSAVDLNAAAPEEDRVEINPLYRLGDVFGKLFDTNISGMWQTRELFFDVCMHYIVQLDLREGLTKEDFYCGLIAADIKKGLYGETAGKRFGYFAGAEQKAILRACLQLYRSGNDKEAFGTVVAKLYPHAIIYENNETAYELLVYMGTEDTDMQRERAAFLREMFLPVQETVHFFYAHHFGIIDVEETMAADEMVLF